MKKSSSKVKPLPVVAGALTVAGFGYLYFRFLASQVASGAITEAQAVERAKSPAVLLGQGAIPAVAYAAGFRSFAIGAGAIWVLNGAARLISKPSPPEVTAPAKAGQTVAFKRVPRPLPKFKVPEGWSR